MRLLVLSDVHADAYALDKVLAHASRRVWDEAVFLGDAVGYGADASAVIGRLSELPLRAAVIGNHEAMLNELREGRRPNAAPSVTEVLRRNLDELSEKDLSFIDSLVPAHLEPALGASDVDETNVDATTAGESSGDEQKSSCGAVHGALRKPFEYLISVPAVRANESQMLRDTYLVGHTHVPVAFVREEGSNWRTRSFTTEEGTVGLGAGVKGFLNPGSVSLPRDRIPSNSYAIFDENTREFTVYRLA